MLFSTSTDVSDFEIRFCNHELQPLCSANRTHLTISVRDENMQITPCDVMVMEWCDDGTFILLAGDQLSRVFQNRDDLGRFCFVFVHEGVIRSTQKVTIDALVKAKQELKTGYVCVDHATSVSLESVLLESVLA